ncbi:unnamed protein product [Paramecium primaurelia]|uniref:Anoctamin transmembrane domain-containing protein n=1 Tax=Paramecium primaurelia TaxID=5886 RepID=A0A8S1NBM7_PARPR|nr:unnamed protein product [Paramecium primaurelia]
MKQAFNQLYRQHTISNNKSFTLPTKQSLEQSYQDVKFQFVMQFSKNTTQEQLEQIVNILLNHGFQSYKTRNLQNDKILLFICIGDPKIILEQAEQMQLYKLVIDRSNTQMHDVYKKIAEKINVKKILDERLVIALNQIDQRIVKFENYQKFKYDLKSDFCLQNDDAEIIKIFSPSETLLIIYNYLHTIKIGDLDMIHFLKTEEYLLQVTPIHDEIVQLNSVSDIERYFGGNLAVYFEFMNFYQSMLKYLAIAAIITLVIDHQSSLFKITNVASFYAVVTMVWSTFFIIAWRRKENELSVEWGVFGQQHIKRLDLNPEYKGKPKMNYITGLVKNSYPTSSRIFYYMVSLFEAIPILIIAGLIKIVVFNINGLIRNESSIFYIRLAAKLNQEGGLLYYKYTTNILDIFTILLIFYINTLYTKVCINSTKRENHRTNLRFYNSLILKRFSFELINRFFHLFYIAFIEFDIPTLRSLLIKLFVMDQIRRVLLESLLPLLMKQKYEKQKEQYCLNLQKKEDINEKIVDRIAELELWEYDDFDDYIEVIFQYGYIVLFAAIFPLAAALTYIFNFIEIWSDKFKLANKLYQRNLPKKAYSIGEWRMVLMTLSVLSIYTNTAFIALAYFNVFDTCQKSGCDWENILLLLFIIEHFSLGLKYIVQQTINSKPKWVRIVLRRMKRKRRNFHN